VVTLADVQATVDLFANKSLPGHLPAWARMVRKDVQRVGSDDFTACVWLNRDHWQPLSLMDFKILPKRAFQQVSAAELEAFNKSPVGTGPYVLGPALEENQVRFLANPHYRQPGKPYINEIIFHRLTATTAKNLFLQGKIHLLYDVQPDHVTEIRQQRRTVKTVPTHSVWFLAPRYGSNKRSSPMDDVNLRLAIAHQIERGKILDQYYRVNQNSADHAELTGPYPRKSWAYNNKGMAFSPTKASGYIEKAGDKNAKIRLVFPDTDPTSSTAQACTEIHKQLEPLKLNIELVPVAPEAYADTVRAGNFELAYWRHDFKDQSYWLAPLLEPQGIGLDEKTNIAHGPNFMRYYQDQDLADLFSQLNSHKQFPELRDLTHKVHRHIFEKAIVIPLWQLDTYVAVDDALRNVRLDPWVLYGNVEEWDLRLRTK
jgi:ABC-type transport system substrate-binding protein